MGAIVDFISGIGNGIKAIVDFAINFFEDIAYIIKLTAEFVVKIPEYLSFLPAPVLAVFVSIFSVVVIYKVLGRE